MLSFRVDPDEAAALEAAAAELGVDRSTVLRDALHRRLTQLKAERDGMRWNQQPLDRGERALMEIEAWGPSEDWSDWVDAAR